MYPVSERYGRAVRNGGTQTCTVTALLNGQPVSGASDLGIVSGSVTDTSAPGVRRSLDLELSPLPGLRDKLVITGTQVRVTSVLRYPDGTTESVPMGLFEVDSTSVSYGSKGTIKLQGSDRWVKIQRARFLIPQVSVVGVDTRQQIAALIREALGPSEPVAYNVPLTSNVGAYAWDQDRDKAIIELDESIGTWTSFSRTGAAEINPMPLASARSAAWVIDASASGILLDASRSVDRTKTYNVVVVNSDKVDGSVLFDPQIVWDQDPNSPTYAGTNPLTAANVGPFGIVPYHFTSPLLQNAPQGVAAGTTILARVMGLNSQLTLSAVRNHALDVFDVIDVQLPRERYDIPIPVERHIIDKIVHPLTPDGVQQIDTRSTRTDST